MKNIGLTLLGALTLTGCGSDYHLVDPTQPTGGSSAPTTPSSVRSDVSCTKSQIVGGKTYTFAYDVTLFYNGATSTTCSIKVQSSGYVYSGTRSYTEGEANSGIAACQVNLDIDTSSNGHWLFLTDRGAPETDYIDPTSSNNSYIVFFSLTTNCTQK